jgi:hypothetical protein
VRQAEKQDDFEEAAVHARADILKILCKKLLIARSREISDLYRISKGALI